MFEPLRNTMVLSTFARSKSTFAIALDAANKLVTPKMMLNNPFALVSNEMKSLTNNIMLLIGSGNPMLNKVTNYYFETEGKKVRPLLVLLLSRALSAIPIEQRNSVNYDDKDFVTTAEIITKEQKNYPNSIKANEKNYEHILKLKPVESFSSLDILNGVNPFNPLTKNVTNLPEMEFDQAKGIFPKQRRLAEVVEMIHTASLLHDDVIDHADKRRGRPSGNIAFNNKMAVLAGDFLLGRATVAISRLRNPEVVELMSNCIANLVEGEFMQLHNTKDDLNKMLSVYNDVKNVNDSNIQDSPKLLSEELHKQNVQKALEYYLYKSYLKTGSLISKSLRSAAILSGAQRPIIDSCYEFGKNLGLCFQLVDDMLDFTSTSKIMGKPATNDLKLGISTAPVIFAWEKDQSLGPLIHRNFNEPGDIEKVLQSIRKYDGLKKTKQLAEEYKDKALQNIRDSLPESDSRSALELLTNSILLRRK